MAANTPFRLLDLPRELRNAVYLQVLCDWPEWDAFGDNKNRRFIIPTKIAFMDHMIETAILLVNRQVSQEAKQVMLVYNQFVHISMRVGDVDTLYGVFISFQIPIVATGPNRCARFMDIAVMSHHISTPAINSLTTFDAILLRRDLDRFCQALHLVDGVTPLFAAGSKHKITIHDPFTKTSIPDYLNRKNQELLLLPYRQCLRGFRFVDIGGRVEPNLAEAVVTEVKQAATLPPPQEFLAKVSGLEELGKQHFEDNNIAKASVAWTRATIEVRRAIRTKAWVPLKEAGGKYFTDRASELFFEVQSHRIHMFMKVMQKNASVQNSVKESARFIRAAFMDARFSRDMLDTDWEPEDGRKAELSYLLAKSQRLAHGSWPVAEDAIGYAAQILPDDPMVQEEKFLVAKWKDGHWVGFVRS